MTTILRNMSVFISVSVSVSVIASVTVLVSVSVFGSISYVRVYCSCIVLCPRNWRQLVFQTRLPSCLQAAIMEGSSSSTSTPVGKVDMKSNESLVVLPEERGRSKTQSPSTPIVSPIGSNWPSLPTPTVSSSPIQPGQKTVLACLQLQTWRPEGWSGWKKKVLRTFFEHQVPPVNISASGVLRHGMSWCQQKNKRPGWQLII